MRAYKGKRARTVGLPAQALHIIVRLAQDLDASDLVFPGEHPNAARRASKMVDSDFITMRDFRAKFATLAGATDVVRAVQEALGHASLRMTQIYLHSTRARSRRRKSRVRSSIWPEAGPSLSDPPPLEVPREKMTAPPKLPSKGP